MNPLEKEAYNTHLNYIRNLSHLVTGSTLVNNFIVRKGAIPHVGVKSNLINLTRQSLNDEHAIVVADQDYSFASTSWLPVKSYYLIFNILLTIDYVRSLSVSSFNLTHTACVNLFTQKLESQEIQFSNAILNQVFDSTILNQRFTSGANLSSQTSSSDLYRMTLKKIARYKDEEWRRKEKINLRLSTHRKKHKQYLQNNFKVSLFDFAYYMRIRANYRDFAFIEGISTQETAEYFFLYHQFTIELSRCLENLKLDMTNQRLGQ